MNDNILGFDLEDGHITDERNRYFTGKYMTARDLRAEQDYFLSRHRAHNRILHGWGVVCGLSVSPHPQSDCNHRWIRIGSGIALDCFGREIIVREPFYEELPLPLRKSEAQAGDEENKSEPEIFRRPFLVCLRYSEQKIEMVAALHSENCDPQHLESNRVRETYTVCFIPYIPEDDCWRDRFVAEHDDNYRPPCIDDCDDEVAQTPGGSCLDLNCGDCGPLIPIALVRPQIEGNYLADDFRLIPCKPSKGEKDEACVPTLDVSGRRKLPTPPQYLTRIVAINWRHGEVMSLEQLENTLNRKLTIRFDRKIAESNGDGDGVNLFTFIVTYSGIQGDDEYIAIGDEIPPRLSEDGCVAEFTIPKFYFGLKAGSNIFGNTVRVRLLCDFIMDCHGNAVDGSHIGGKLPSGNGTPGGIFESWFTVGLPETSTGKNVAAERGTPAASTREDIDNPKPDSSSAAEE